MTPLLHDRWFGLMLILGIGAFIVAIVLIWHEHNSGDPQ